MIFVSTDILNPYKREIISQDSYSTLIDFLVEKFPDGFKRPTDISVNGHEVALADYDIKLQEDDVIVLLDRAALPVGLIGGWFITALANLAISVTLSYVANKLFAPDAPQDQGTPSPVYNLNSSQNTARYGSPIPIVYGTVRMYPSMIVQPYYKFEDEIEYLYHVLCIGQGTLTTDTIYIGEDEITNPGDVQWKLLNKADFYNIPLKGYGIHLNKTLSTPSNIEIGGGSDGVQGPETEKYRISADASKVEFDYMFPNGLFWNNDGSLEAAHATFEFRIYTLSGTTYTEVFKQTFSLYEKSIDAIQRTYTKDISSYTQDVYVSFKRTIQSSDIRVTQDLYVKRVKEIYPNEDFTQRYGDITLLAVKIKATNAVSSAGQVKVNGYFTRTDVGNTMSEVLTDIYTNTTYGGGLSGDDLDFPVTTETVNCAYDSNMTIFDAMRRPALAQGYSLYLAGMDVILKKDGVNAVTTAMYNEMNILRNSFKAQYLFKEEYPAYDGFKCTYIDGDGWIQKSSTYPTTSSRPQVVDLFGVVDYSGGNFSVTDCSLSTVNPPDTGNYSRMIDTGDGILLVRMGIEGYIRKVAYDDLTSVSFTISAPSISYLKGVCLLGNGDIFVVMDEVHYIYTSSGSLDRSFVVPSTWTVSSDYGNNCFYNSSNDTVLVAAGLMVDGSSNAYIGAIEYNHTTGAIVNTYVTGTYYTTYPGETDVVMADGNVYVGTSIAFKYTSSGGVIYGGMVNKFSYGGSHLSTIYTGEGTSDSANEKAGGKLYVTSKYIVIVSGYNIHANEPNPSIIYESIYCKLTIVSRVTGDIIKTIEDPNFGSVAFPSSNLYGSGFGTDLHDMGGYIVIGSPRADGSPVSGTDTGEGKVYLYDSDFNYMLTVNSEPLTDTVDGCLGGAVLAADNKIYMVQSNYNVSNDNVIEVCSYSVYEDSSLIADQMAKYLYKQDESRRKIVSFSTDIQGLIPQFLDKIMVSHSSLQWGDAGEVYDRSGDDLVISDAIEDLTGSKTIVFRNIDGSVSAPYPITVTSATRVTVPNMPAWVDDGIFYTIQESGTAREFLVISVKPSGDTVQIDCVNYDETIYN